jgi:cytochrome c5
VSSVSFTLNIQAEFEKGNSVTQQEDRNFLKMLFIVLGALTVFFILSITIARIVGKGGETAASAPDAMVESAAAERIKPFGEVNVGEAPVAVASGAADGKGTYTASCSACHGTGAAGSPKFGDKGAWKSRIAQGLDTLYGHALKGFKGMPAKGGNPGLSDDAVKAAVKYMADNSK